MIINNNIITDFNIKTPEDLYKLKPLLEVSTLKINKSQIARELDIDRRTVDKYIKGYKKPTTRASSNCLAPYEDIIKELLSEENPQVFYYKRVLWQYLKDNHGYTGSYVNFCKYIKENKEFNDYFQRRRPSNVNSKPTIRFETGPGKQAQLDWKESIEFTLSTGEVITVNVFVLLLSYSRFRVYRLSLSKAQDILLNFMDEAFQIFGGVPHEILTDNMKTVMDVSRTEKFKGKVNEKFQQFANDYGFKVKPCIARRPKTKAKVEAPMKILDEIRAYNGKFDYDELNVKLTEINNRVNSEVSKGCGRIPIMYLEKEKDFLNPLPSNGIRKSYQIVDRKVKVNDSSMFNYQNCQYSVPPRYIGKTLTLQVYDNYIYAYCNTKLVAVHAVSDKKLNYLEKHYIEIASISGLFKEENIQDIAKKNLEDLGRVFSYE